MKRYNEKKFCFIICANHQQYLKECLLYLSLLQIPQGYEIECITITEAKSMTSGYEEGRTASDAKYKIYLHQDTLIIEPEFLSKILAIFQSDPEIGMIGMIGAPKLSKDAVMWHEERCGDFYRLEELLQAGVEGITQLKNNFCQVEAVDGLLMATQYDLPWRQDILKEWDFYDVSQCLEFRRAGYRIVVPAQNPSWTIHACGVPLFWNYEKNRQIIQKEYSEFFQKEKGLRILFVHSNMITLMGLAYTMTEMGHTVKIPAHKVMLTSLSQRDREIIEEELEEGHYNLVVTYDFCPSVSIACEQMQVKYFAWVYDSPLLELYTKQAKSDCNYITVFDRRQYERLQVQKIPHLYHIPLATEVKVFGGVVVSKEDEKKYQADISFVGRLYEKRGFERLFDGSDKKLLEEAEAVVHSTQCVWKKQTSIFDQASDTLIDYISAKEPEAVWDLYQIDKRYYCESMRLARRCNELERVAILNKLAEHYSVTLYTEQTQNPSLKNVKICPWVDYWQEMPKVFYLSKINLNITSRSIESGIPQRVWDIMAVGGFVLTNYQPELEEYFEIGKDLEVYHNIEELVEKAGYYLKHEKQRVRIAMNGYQKVRKMHNYQKRLEKILNWIFDSEGEGHG